MQPEPIPTPLANAAWTADGWRDSETRVPALIGWPPPAGWRWQDRRVHPWLFDGQRTPAVHWWDRLPARALQAWRRWVLGPLDQPAPILPELPEG